MFFSLVVYQQCFVEFFYLYLKLVTSKKANAVNRYFNIPLLPQSVMYYIFYTANLVPIKKLSKEKKVKFEVLFKFFC